jgi:hypothetical protein
MKLDFYKELFLDVIQTFDFVNPYLKLDLDFKNRDYNTLRKDKISNIEVKQKLKEEFKNYTIANGNGGIYLRRKINNIWYNFFFKFNANIFQAYFEIFLEEEKFENLINHFTSGVSICRYLLNDSNYPIKSKVFSNTSELIFLIKNEVAFYELLIELFEAKIKSLEY